MNRILVGAMVFLVASIPFVAVFLLHAGAFDSLRIGRLYDVQARLNPLVLLVTLAVVEIALFGSLFLESRLRLLLGLLVLVLTAAACTRVQLSVPEGRLVQTVLFVPVKTVALNLDPDADDARIEVTSGWCCIDLDNGQRRESVFVGVAPLRMDTARLMAAIDGASFR